MAIVDVFRNISDRIHVFQKTSWSNVPDRAGVYAWFYPIKVTSNSLDDFLAELRAVRNYDARHQGQPQAHAYLPFAWTNLSVTACIEPRASNFPDTARVEWDQIVNDDDAFIEFRKTLLVSSLLMPPLYVGKTRSLMRRCAQHRGVGKHVDLNASNMNDFRSRFERFASDHDDIKTNRVEDLIMACVFTTQDEKIDAGSDQNEKHGLLEEILKTAARPAYGLK